MKFRDIPKFPRAHYGVDVPWTDIERHLESWDAPVGILVLDPEYQRAHVWSREQQIAFVEYRLQGGEVGGTLIFNCPHWLDVGRWGPTPIELVDGKQRLEAARAFLRGDIPAFGKCFAEFTDRLPFVDCTFRFQVCKLETRDEILRLYLNINAGGTPHTKAEINKVRAMLAAQGGGGR